ncbi:MAG: 3-dehydroquinate synthase, partial [Pseudomonadota bacterium]
RALLNLGHTFGHALEAWAGYSDGLLHGEAVAIGMTLAFRLSEELDLAPPQSAARVAGHLRAMNLPTRISDIPGSARPVPEQLFELMRQDKKVVSGQMTLILARAIGEAFITRDVTPDRLQAFLRHALDS